MLSAKEMDRIRRELGLTYQTVSQVSGVPVSTVQKILKGSTEHPRIDTMVQLEQAIQQLAGQAQTSLQDSTAALSGSYAVHEPQPAYGAAADRISCRVPKATAADRAALPAERRTELIDGVFYDMASPTVLHQKAAMDIYDQLRDCMRTHPSSCELFMAPADVYLDKDPYTVVVPDVFIVCDPDKVNRDNIQGAPDFVLEVLSPSTAHADRFIKLEKYRSAGVREYWILDLRRRKVIAYRAITDEAAPAPSDPQSAGSNDYHGFDYDVTTYTLSDNVPLGISDGQCSIDMNVIQKDVDRFSFTGA